MENMEKNLWKQVCTGNQMHIYSTGIGDLTPGSVVHSTREELLPHLLPLQASLYPTEHALNSLKTVEHSSTTLY